MIGVQGLFQAGTDVDRGCRLRKCMGTSQSLFATRTQSVDSNIMSVDPAVGAIVMCGLPKSILRAPLAFSKRRVYPITSAPENHQRYRLPFPGMVEDLPLIGVYALIKSISFAGNRISSVLLKFGGPLIRSHLANQEYTTADSTPALMLGEDETHL